MDEHGSRLSARRQTGRAMERRGVCTAFSILDWPSIPGTSSFTGHKAIRSVWQCRRSLMTIMTPYPWQTIVYTKSIGLPPAAAKSQKKKSKSDGDPSPSTRSADLATFALLIPQAYTARCEGLTKGKRQSRSRVMLYTIALVSPWGKFALNDNTTEHGSGRSRVGHRLYFEYLEKGT